MYTSRIVGVGTHKGNPLVSFILSSKSIPYRELRVNEKGGKINVFPKEGYENHPTNQDPEVDNYSCIRTGKTKSGDYYMVTFNGHMCKRTEANIKDGINPLIALDLTLLEFRGARNDARIGGVSFRDKDGDISLYLGMNDADKCEKRICAYPNERVQSIDDKILFIYDKGTDLEKIHKLNISDTSATELAAFLHHNIIGEEILFGIATGVAIMKGTEFELGVYNSDFDEGTLKKWGKI